MNAVGSITVEANDSDPARARNFLTTKMPQIVREITVDFRDASLFPREVRRALIGAWATLAERTEFNADDADTRGVVVPFRREEQKPSRGCARMNGHWRGWTSPRESLFNPRASALMLLFSGR
jgi:hypothetical protein